MADKSNISIAAKNGYRMDKVLKAKEYLEEIGGNRRNFNPERLVEMYNDIKGTNEKAIGCKPCAMNKFYNGIQNYFTYGKLTLITNGLATEADFEKKKVEEEKPIENAENRLIGVDAPQVDKAEEKPKKTKAKKQE